MRIAITGADGFLGWHARCVLRASGTDEVVAIGRAAWRDQASLDAAFAGADAVLHLAGANRDEPDRLREVNAGLARQLTESLDRTETRPVVVFANSIQCANGTPFGDGKQAAADHLGQWGRCAGTAIVDVRLPNLFGEHGRPRYNSVVATFCHALANGEEPRIIDDRMLPLLHAQDAVDLMLGLVDDPTAFAVVEPEGRLMAVSALLDTLRGFRDLYLTGDIPDVSDPIDLALFNTYRSFCFPQQFPLYPPLRSDPRGYLFECVRGHGGQAQVFCSTTRPGQTRGQHFHLRKIERFVVLRGTAEISLRRLFDDAVVRFDVSGKEPAIVDMPTMWVHSITNIGADELMTLFWAHEILDPNHPDTFAERVDLAEAGS